MARDFLGFYALCARFTPEDTARLRALEASHIAPDDDPFIDEVKYSDRPSHVVLVARAILEEGMTPFYGISGERRRGTERTFGDAFAGEL